MSQDNFRLSRNRPSIEHVDLVLKAEKEFIGEPEYRRPNRDSEQVRLVWPILVNNRSAQCYVSATLYPNDRDVRFSISLVYYEYNIWRLDFVPFYRAEINPHLPGHDNSMQTIWGPHCHPWEENRRLSQQGAIPHPLRFRVPLPKDVKNWENAFRYFAGKVSIHPPQHVPTWPRSERLL